MGITKSDLFSPAQNQLASIAKVLAHPARLAILQHLVTSKSCINTDLVQELGLAQPTISQHLRELKEAGLIQGNIEGTRLNYCINPQRWQEIAKGFQDFFQTYWTSETKSCC